MVLNHALFLWPHGPVLYYDFQTGSVQPHFNLSGSTFLSEGSLSGLEFTGSQYGTINTSWVSASHLPQLWVPPANYVSASFAFDGSNDYIQIPSITLDATWTFSGWARKDSMATWSRVFDFGQGQADDNINLANQDGQSVGMFGYYQGSDSNVTSEVGYWGPTGSWIHFGCTTDGTTMKLYRNGALVDSTTLDKSQTGRTLTSNYIGRSNWSADAYASGSVTDFCIHNLALGASSFQSLYDGSTKPTEISSSNVVCYFPLDEATGKYARQGYAAAVSASLSGTYFNTNAAGLAYDTPFSGSDSRIYSTNDNRFYSYSFNGDTNWIQGPNVEIGAKFSFSGWAKFDSFGSWSRVFDFAVNSTALDTIFLANKVQTTTANFGYHKDDGGGSFTSNDVEVANFWVPNEWVHFACTCDGTTMKLYKNGDKVGDDEELTEDQDGFYSTQSFIGKSYHGSDALLDGAIAEFAFWDIALTADQVASLYNQAKYISSNDI